MQAKNLVLLLLAGSLLLGAALGGKQSPDTGVPAPLPGNPALEPVELVDALPFVLDQEFEHTWRKEQPLFRAGYLLVLRGDEAFLRPRQTAEPVLYVGRQTAERLNAATGSGHLVCLVPAPLAADGTVALDLAATPIWFGAPDLPERIDESKLRRAYDDALASGVKAPGGSLPPQAPDQVVYLRDRNQLDLVIADLIEKFSPLETDLVDGLRVR